MTSPAPLPSLAPGETVVPSAWECLAPTSAGTPDPTASPTPSGPTTCSTSSWVVIPAPPLPASASPLPVPLPVTVDNFPTPGPESETSSCSTTLTTLPSPTAAPTAEPSAGTTSTSSQDVACLAVLHPQQFTAYGVGLALVLLLLSALLVAALRRG